MDDWQPIETAPRDGTQVILIDDEGEAVIAEYVVMKDGSAGWEAGHIPDFGRLWIFRQLTHWMPLPAPPDVSARKEDS